MPDNLYGQLLNASPQWESTLSYTSIQGKPVNLSRQLLMSLPDMTPLSGNGTTCPGDCLISLSWTDIICHRSQTTYPGNCQMRNLEERWKTWPGHCLMSLLNETPVLATPAYRESQTTCLGNCLAQYITCYKSQTTSMGNSLMRHLTGRCTACLGSCLMSLPLSHHYLLHK